MRQLSSDITIPILTAAKGISTLVLTVPISILFSVFKFIPAPSHALLILHSVVQVLF